MPKSHSRKGVKAHQYRGTMRRPRRWGAALIGPNSHPRKVRRWMRALSIGIGSATGNWPEDILQKAAARHTHHTGGPNVRKAD